MIASPNDRLYLQTIQINKRRVFHSRKYGNHGIRQLMQCQEWKITLKSESVVQINCSVIQTDTSVKVQTILAYLVLKHLIAECVEFLVSLREFFHWYTSRQQLCM